MFSPKGGTQQAIVKRIDRAKVSVHLAAYSFTAQPIADALLRAKLKHLDVQVILDKSWQTESPKVEKFLVESGIPVAIDGKHAIAHTKIIIIDGKLVVTGSYNFTGQAENSNWENTVFIPSKALAAKYEADFAVHLAHSVSAMLGKLTAFPTGRIFTPLFSDPEKREREHDFLEMQIKHLRH